LNKVLEICCYNLASAILAQQAGAQRVELCADPGDGGTTPGYGVIATARKRLHIELYPIIRPRGGDFLYTEEEFGIMMKEVALCKQLGCDGVALGLLNADGTVDTQRTARLVELAYPLGVTFHRAFDRTPDPFAALEEIIAAGCERILSSGQRPTATEGAALLRELVGKADDRILIMPGSGVRASNIDELVRSTGASEFHTSASRLVPSRMNYTNPSMKEELSLVMADPQEIASILRRLSEC
jgi:copper homeostasis protein